MQHISGLRIYASDARFEVVVDVPDWGLATWRATDRASDAVAGEILDGLAAAGWTVTRAPEPPLRRLLLTVPDGTPVETVELSCA